MRSTDQANESTARRTSALTRGLIGHEGPRPILLVPGLGGSGPAHWQTHWQRQLEGARRLIHGDWRTPDLERWTQAVVREVAVSRRAPVVIAHGYACLAAVRAASLGARIRGLLLVAPADPERYDIDEDLMRKRLGCPGIVVASSDDPGMKLVRAGSWAAAWNLRLVVYRNAGHINAESGFGPWPEGLSYVDQLAGDDEAMLPPDRSGTATQPRNLR